MSKHTKGPWTINPNGAFVKAHKVNGTSETVAEVYSDSNAALIATAPEMLEALKLVKPLSHRAGDCFSDDYMGACVCGLERIEAVIAKAEGRAK